MLLVATGVWNLDELYTTCNALLLLIEQLGDVRAE